MRTVKRVMKEAYLNMKKNTIFFQYYIAGYVTVWHSWRV